jgi:hypothetical protein
VETRVVFTSVARKWVNIATEQKSLPLYDVGASFRLTRVFTPRSNIKMAFKINNPDLDSFKKWTKTKI